MNDYFSLFAIGTYFIVLSVVMAIWVKIKEAQDKREHGEQRSLDFPKSDEKEEHRHPEMAAPVR
jgi:hypothetical protein